ncbi:long-chain acyl-CoA synthetase [Bradyrhizobium japonicum]
MPMLAVHDMLSRTARDNPDKEAIVLGGQRLSFAELEDRATRIAGFLRSRVDPGARVAMHGPKCVDEVAVIFAIVKAGAVMVHINPAFRDEQLQHVLAGTEPAAVFFHPSKEAAIARAAQRGLLPDVLIRTGGARASHGRLAALALGAIGADWPRTPWPAAAVSEDDLAALIYTSGTTARAKGIKVTHRILSDATVVSAGVLENGPRDRLISITPFSFDGALSQLFTATLVGGTLVLQDSTFPADIVRTLVTERITGFHAMPSLWRMMLNNHAALLEPPFPDLRYVSLIGEVFPERELSQLRRALGTTDFYMMYGTTEAFRSTCLAPSELSRKPRSVGRPLPGVTITVVDEDGRSCAPGTVGEIVHSGAFVSPGYWKMDRNATFRADGVHTGDLGMLDDEGYLYFVGRKDTMIKRLGHQVYPEEIEQCLTRIDGIAMAAVVCGQDDRCAPTIRAIVARAPGATVTYQAVARACALELPHYMRPDEIEFCAAIPLTSTHKIDRAALALAAAP